MDAVLFVVLAAALYFAPWISAHARNHPNRTAIFLLNLFLGWTLLGWVAALVWAFVDPSPLDIRPVINAPAPQPPPATPTPPLPMGAKRPATLFLSEERQDGAEALSKRVYPSFIAGLAHRGPNGENRSLIIATLGPGALLALRREPDNPHDPSAVAVVHGDKHLGYIPRRHPWVAQAIDDGEPIAAMLGDIHMEGGTVTQADLLVMVVDETRLPRAD